MTTLKLAHLSKVYESSRTGVFDLDLTVEAGELMVLLGPSGCGKTTTLRMIAGLTAPTTGEIFFNDVCMLDVPPEKRGAAMVFQQHALFPFMSVGDNVAFGLKVRRLNRSTIQARVASALAAVQLPGYEERWPAQLSGGQQQRIALARVLAIEPRVLLLDEPFSHLDRSLREELREVVRTIQQKAGITTLFVTHDQSEADALADRIGVMFDGRLHQVGLPRDLYERPQNPTVAKFFGAVNIFAGEKRGTEVYTALGALAVADSALPDGNVLLAIRPEAIEIGANGHNNLTATVRACQVRGMRTTCRAELNNVALQVATPPYQHYQENEQIILHLPKERICLFPNLNICRTDIVPTL